MVPQAVYSDEQIKIDEARGRRIPLKTLSKIAEVKGIRDVRSSLESMVDLLLNYPREEQRIVTRYDSTSGEPIDYGWMPETFKERNKLRANTLAFRLPGEMNCRDPTVEELGLNSEVVRKIAEEGPYAVDTPFGKYVFTHEHTRAGDTDSLKMSVAKLTEYS